MGSKHKILFTTGSVFPANKSDSVSGSAVVVFVAVEGAVGLQVEAGIAGLHLGAGIRCIIADKNLIRVAQLAG